MLTLKQRKFTEQYLESGNATEAAMQVYNPRNRATARAIGSENLTKPNVRAYLEVAAANATAMIYKLSQKARNESVRLNACRDILDRAGYFVDKSKTVEQQPKILHLPYEIAERNGSKNGDIIGDAVLIIDRPD